MNSMEPFGKERYYKRSNAENATDRFSNIEIKRRQRIGEGAYGTVDLVNCDVVRGEKRRPIALVVKTYKDSEFATNESDAQEALQNYNILKNAGLKVFPTCRISEDAKKIVMTSGMNDTTVCLGTNAGSSTMDDFQEQKLNMVNEFPHFLKEFFGQATIATEHDILLERDAYFLLVDTLSHTLNFVLGDVDEVYQVDYQVYYPDKSMDNDAFRARAYQELLKSNFLVLRSILQKFLPHVVVDSEQLSVELQDFYEQLLSKHQLHGVQIPYIDWKL